MAVLTKFIELATHGNAEIIDITPRLRELLHDTGLVNGMVAVFVPGATGGLTTIEYEPGLVQDFGEFWEKLIPADRPYQHDMTWGDKNGHSHLRAALLGPSLVIPFYDGSLALGTWQQAVFLDFDTRPRSRRLVAQFIGEG
ncbi:MAG: secondary thiamine-phosphate synthase enzyme YjbQ [Candidatus Latescibacterota bacterium]